MDSKIYGYVLKEPQVIVLVLFSKIFKFSIVNKGWVKILASNEIPVDS